MKKFVVLAVLVLVAPLGLAVAGFSGTSSVPCSCCVDCECEQCACEALGCDCTGPGGCTCEGVCCDSGCCDSGCCEAAD